MDQHINRLKRELKFRGKILDFYQDTMEITGDSGTHTVIWDLSDIKSGGCCTGYRGWKDPDGPSVQECPGALYA